MVTLASQVEPIFIDLRKKGGGRFNLVIPPSPLLSGSEAEQEGEEEEVKKVR